jgi:hypothetical protein
MQSQGMADPVFVLCAARTGSTLLRFLLDAHPELACPPETDVPELCKHLAKTGGLLTGMPVQPGRDGQLAALPPAVATGIRGVVGQLVGQHLARRGKRVFCDKSLFTARHAEMMLQVFPGARFLCLYRHPMDMVASGIEACPWGLKGFGFDPYVAGSPGSDVLALARYWADHAAEIRAVEERHGQRCHRVRYEDLVTDPEAVAAGIFGFIGVQPSPGISARCFGPERERMGPGDYKIWHTSRITADSVGRGWSIPAEQIDEPVRARINDLADALGYLRIDEKWSVADTPPDLRAKLGAGVAPVPEPPDIRVTRQMPRGSLLLGERLQAGVFGISDRFIRDWGSCTQESFLVIATSATGDDAVARWRVDLASRTVSLGGSGEVSWEVIGSATTWDQVLSETANLNVALRHRELRYCDTGTVPGSVTVARIDMLANLLGVTSWRSSPRPAATGAPSAA